MDKDLVKFKNVLEYFIAHQNYVQSNSELAVGYEKYIKPRIINHDFNYTGQGYNGDRIQEHIKDWEIIKNHTICINVQPNFGSYTSKKSYLNWIETGVNIFCQWNDNKVNALAVGYAYWWHKPTEYKLLLTKTIEELGLFKENEYNQNLEDFYNSFVQEIYDYDNHKGIYYQELQKYYKKLEADKNMEKNKAYRNILSSNYNLILTGAPGTGKTYLAKQIAAQMILGKDYDEEVESEKEKMEEQYGFVQFHPSYDYTDFVEGMRPNNNGTFTRTDGVFKRFCKCAIWGLGVDVDDNELADKERNYKETSEPSNDPYVFIIDEINRGEISKIFGELFFCIESSHRGEKERMDTQYQNLVPEDDLFSKGFYVPDNVYIIGTMNDIDRSVESMDFAFRRRFAFYEVPADSDMLNTLADYDSKTIEEIKQHMERLNKELIKDEYGLSSAYQIGGAYFLNFKKYYSGQEYKERKVLNAFNSLWNNHLRGTIYEYFRGMPQKELIVKMEKLN